MLHPVLERERRTVSAYLSAAAHRLRLLLPRVEAGADIEALHQFRVDLRRIRTGLAALAGRVPLADAAGLVAECRWLASRGSELRDVDVLRDRLQEYLGSEEPVDAAALRRLHAGLGRIHGAARRALLGALRSRRAHRLVERLQALGSLVPESPGWPDQPTAGASLWASYRRVRRLGRSVHDDSAPEDLHELRKRCKRLRYQLEMYGGAFDDAEVPDMVRRLRKLQNVLGDYQDFHTHARMLAGLRAAAVDSGQPDPAFLALVDRLLAVLDLRAAAARARFAARFAQFAARRHHAQRRALFAPDPALARPFIGTGGYCHGWLAGERVRLPVGKIVCVGRNYAAHAAELGNPVPETPLLFIKPPSAAVDMAPLIRVPVDRGPVHHELEIALLIGRELRAATEEEAIAAIAGIGLALDLTLRGEQDALKAKAHPWEVAKGFDGACPLSPFVPLDPALDLRALQLRLVVNGRRRQFGSSAQMLTPIVELLCHASRCFSLWPGDVLLTGTPAGVGPLVPGDRFLAELAGVVRLRAQVVA
jgi:2-keto-4-pentenoate hydratase/2-oxohepta-3-ene-1,7-dioic acid hydratase in catechol pathway